MSESEAGQRQYEAYRDHLHTALQSAHEQYDRAILTLSTGLLGLSVTFIKSDSATAAPPLRCLLVLSWVFLLLAIISTLVSFLFSQRALRKALNDAHELYILKRNEVLQKKNVWSQATELLNAASGCFFLTGALLTVLFVTFQGK